MEETTLNISVIIPHEKKRGAFFLDRCIESINRDAGRCNYRLEILVETDGNISQARNRGIEKASNNLLVFVDSDVVVRRNCLRELVEPFCDPKVALVSGVNIAFADVQGMEKYSATLYSSPLIMLKSASRYTPRGNIREADESEMISCVMAGRKEAILLAGGFPENIIPCEENILINNLKRVGFKTLYNPFAIVYHHRPDSLRQFVSKSFHYGFGRGMMIRKGYGSPKMIWAPKKEWLIYFCLAFLHYVAYISGLIKGLWKGERKT